VGDLAGLYQVSEGTIVRIRDGRTWGWLKTEKDKMEQPVLQSLTKEQEKEMNGQIERLLEVQKEAQAGNRAAPEIVGKSFSQEQAEKVEKLFGVKVRREGEGEGDCCE
jgi:hypothetical protein